MYYFGVLYNIMGHWDAAWCYSRFLGWHVRAVLWLGRMCLKTLQAMDIQARICEEALK